MIHSFLLIGQSNMAGRGLPEEVEPIPSDNILVLRNGLWRPMYVPVNPDRRTSGICLAESFAYSFTKAHSGVQAGLIPCADGGTKLDQWAPGKVLYDHAVMTAKLAMRTSQLRGILWHQGESDCGVSAYPKYREKCTHIMESLRQSLGMPNIPIIVGGLGEYLADCPKSPVFKNYVYVNQALQEMAAADPDMGYASSEGLPCNADYMHFSAAGLREFGLRYFEAFLPLDKYDYSKDSSASVQITEIEKL